MRRFRMEREAPWWMNWPRTRGSILWGAFLMYSCDLRMLKLLVSANSQLFENQEWTGGKPEARCNCLNSFAKFAPPRYSIGPRLAVPW